MKNEIILSVMSEELAAKPEDERIRHHAIGLAAAVMYTLDATDQAISARLIQDLELEENGATVFPNDTEQLLLLAHIALNNLISVLPIPHYMEVHNDERTAD